MIKPRILAVGSFLLLLLEFNSAEIFTSSDDLTSAFVLEGEIVPILKDLVALLDTEEEKTTIQRYVKEYDKAMESIGEEEEVYLEHLTGNPITAFLLMRRLYVDWQPIKTLIDKKTANDKELGPIEKAVIGKILEVSDAKDLEDLEAALIEENSDRTKEMSERLSSFNWTTVENDITNLAQKRELLDQLEQLIAGSSSFPQEEDYTLAAQAILRLQETYELETSHLVKGNVSGKQTLTAELSAEDCLFIGQQAILLGTYKQGVEWLVAASTMALEQDRTDAIENNLKEFIDKHSNGPKAPERQPDERFCALCRGETLLNKEVSAKLTCWYDHRNQSYFLLMPILVEQHSFNPLLLQFHNIISDDEIELVKDIARPLLVRSQVGTSGLTNETSYLRTSQSAALNGTMDPLLQRLSKRIGLITGLGADPLAAEADNFQVAFYGIGGHYTPHYDYFLTGTSQERESKKQKTVMGDRIATFMFYLNKVEAGGATAFPKARVAVPPVKGSAAFWYNLKRNGNPDPTTVHPVALFFWAKNG